MQAKFGASGLLKDEIAAAARRQVFASANMEHPQALGAGKERPRGAVRAQPAVRAGAARARGQRPLLDRMLDPQVKLGTSTPKADPSGDYAWEVFRKAEKLKPGARADAGEEGAAAHRRAHAAPAPPGPLDLWRAHRARRRRYLPDLLHQCARRAAGKSRATDRGTARRPGGRRRLRPAGDRRRVAGGAKLRAVHRIGGRRGDPFRLRLRGRATEHCAWRSPSGYDEAWMRASCSGGRGGRVSSSSSRPSRSRKM